MHAPLSAQTGFAAELHSVHERLESAAAELGSPLSELVRARLRAVAPPLSGALVLAAAYDAQASGSGLEHRIALAAALEMLNVALSVHQLLVSSAAAALDKSFIGSAILAGDYCFGRAARLAAQTDNPTIVILFSQALQDFSEGHLRSYFNAAPATRDGIPDAVPEVPPFDGLAILLHFGAAAALELSDLAPDARQTVRELAARLAEARTADAPRRAPVPSTWLDDDLLACLPAAYQARWRAFEAWLAASAPAS